MPWNDVSKPTGTPYTNVAKPSDGGTLRAGAYMGPLGLTYARDFIITYWSNVAKPTGSSWNNVAKPID